MARKFIAVFLMLCLPLQAVAAMAMPFCQPAAPQAMTEHCDHAGSQSAAPSDGQQTPQGHDACDNCGFCHLASAGLITISFLPSSEHPPARVYQLPREQAHASHIPEQPQRPPSRA